MTNITDAPEGGNPEALEAVGELVQQEAQVSAPAVHVERAETSDPLLALIERVARDPSVDIERMESLLNMHERVKGSNAKAAFVQAFANMQPELPEIDENGGIKDRSGNVQSTYALWEDINDAIKPVLKEYGFALSFRVKHTNNVVSVTGVLSHFGGHTEETTLDLPTDTSGSKNAVQAIASSISYGKRYSATMLLNITTRNEKADDDGAGAVNNISSAKAKEQGIWDKIMADFDEAVKRGSVPYLVERKDYWKAYVPKQWLGQLQDKFMEYQHTIKFAEFEPKV